MAWGIFVLILAVAAALLTASVSVLRTRVTIPAIVGLILGGLLIFYLVRGARTIGCVGYVPLSLLTLGHAVWAVLLFRVLCVLSVVLFGVALHQARQGSTRLLTAPGTLWSILAFFFLTTFALGFSYERAREAYRARPEERVAAVLILELPWDEADDNAFGVFRSYHPDSNKATTGRTYIRMSDNQMHHNLGLDPLPFYGTLTLSN